MYILIHLKQSEYDWHFNRIQIKQRAFYANSHEYNVNWANKNLSTYCVCTQKVALEKNFTTGVPTHEDHVGIV